MANLSKINRLLVDLTRATVEGQLLWVRANPPLELTSGTHDVVPTYYEATRKEHKIALFVRRFQTFSGEYEQFFWQERLVFAFLDSSRRISWDHSDYSPGLQNLFDAVKEKNANVDGLIDDLLSDEPPKATG